MRDLIQDKEINDSYGLITSRDMIAEYINRAIAAEAALAAKTDECEAARERNVIYIGKIKRMSQELREKTEECERLRNIFKDMEWELNCFGTAYNCPACGELKEDGHNVDCWIGNAIKKGAE